MASFALRGDDLGVDEGPATGADAGGGTSEYSVRPGTIEEGEPRVCFIRADRIGLVNLFRFDVVCAEWSFGQRREGRLSGGGRPLIRKSRSSPFSKG